MGKLPGIEAHQESKATVSPWPPLPDGTASHAVDCRTLLLRAKRPPKRGREGGRGDACFASWSGAGQTADLVPVTDDNQRSRGRHRQRCSAG
jgi:hypothetical protein